MEPVNLRHPIFRHIDDPNVLLDKAEKKKLQTLVLVKAAVDGCVHLMDCCIEREYNLNPTDSKGPLFYALVKKHVAVAKKVHERGGDVNHVYNGRSILSYAAEDSRVEVAEFLLENRASPNGVNSYTPLHYAAKKSREMVSLLLKYRASVDPVGKKCFFSAKVTPLAVALERHEVDSVTILLKAGADIRGKGCFVPKSAGVDLKEVVKEYKKNHKSS